MNNILDEIIEYKRSYVKDCKKHLPLRELETLVCETGTTRDFTGALSGKECALIAEIKTASPSKGSIRDDADIMDIARIYAENGAVCISVLTDEKYFKGNLDRLSAVRRAVTLPVLRKDFIIDIYQIYESRVAGADAVLLIAACLDKSELLDYIEISSLLGMDSLVEVHDKAEMEGITHLNTRLVGINNRNLRTFETDISVTGELARYVPDQVLLVSESGIYTAEDVKTVYRMGARAVLVGEALMTAHDMAQKVRELSQAVSYNQTCGNMSH